MQTFLPYPSFTQSAEVLDYKRLGKQRVETKQIYNALTTGKGWIHHPATKMWAGCERALLLYGITMTEEWIARGYKDSMLAWFDFEFYTRWGKGRLARTEVYYPLWFGNEEFHLSHQSNLLRKDPEFYGPKFPGVPDDLPYYWPTKEAV